MKTLPIESYRQQILQAIGRNQVLILLGPTGSGKTTQIPKYILQRNQKNYVLMVQPRRVAAISIAERICQENQDSELAGYQISMKSKNKKMAKILVCTGGIFLQKISHPSEFQEERFSHIIIDQAHQRSIQIDFSLVILKLMLKRKSFTANIIIMSATLQSQKFSTYFAKYSNRKQMIDYSKQNLKRLSQGRGDKREPRTKREEEMSQEFTSCKSYSQSQVVKSQVLDIKTERKFTLTKVYMDQFAQVFPDDLSKQYPKITQSMYEFVVKQILGNSKFKTQKSVLIFVPGLREINVLTQKILKILTHIKEKNIVPVHSKFSDKSLRRIFQTPCPVKIIIATSIAESSITIPDCTLVIDFCLKRHVVYDQQSGRQQFKTKWCSKSTLEQRAGRVGRNQDGICIRIIPSSWEESLRDDDEPQIINSSLERLILRILFIHRKANQKETPFKNPMMVLMNAIDPPSLQDIRIATLKLIRYQACRCNNPQLDFNCLELTNQGLFFNQMPCDVRISRLLIAGVYLGEQKRSLNLAAILHSKKSIFQFEKNMQDYVLTIVGNDFGWQSDMLLQQRLFENWFDKFYRPFRERRKEQMKRKLRMREQRQRLMMDQFMIEQDQQVSDEQEEASEQDYRNQIIICEAFSKHRDQQERQYMDIRSLVRTRLVEILRIRIMFAKKSKKLPYFEAVKRIQPEDLLKLAVLASQVPVFQVKFTKGMQIHPSVRSYRSVAVVPKKPWAAQMTRELKKMIEDFFKNYQKPINVIISPDRLVMQLEPSSLKLVMIYSKVLKPQHIDDETSFGRLLTQCQVSYGQNYAIKDLQQNFKTIVDQQSINSVLIDTKNQVFSGSLSAFEVVKNKSVRLKFVSYFSHQQTVMGLIVFNNCQLIPCDKSIYIKNIVCEGKNFELQFYLLEEHVDLMNKMREDFRQKNDSAGLVKTYFNKLRELKFQPIRAHEEWFEYYLRVILKKIQHKFIQQRTVEENLNQPIKRIYYPFCRINTRQLLNEYIDDYNQFLLWKKQVIRDIANLRTEIAHEGLGILCKHCFRQNGNLTVLFQNQRFLEIGDKLLIDFNPYSDNLVKCRKGQDDFYQCLQKHTLFQKYEGEQDQGEQLIYVLQENNFLVLDASFRVRDFFQDGLQVQSNKQERQKKPRKCFVCDSESRNGTQFMEHLRSKNHVDKYKQFTSLQQRWIL